MTKKDKCCTRFFLCVGGGELCRKNQLSAINKVKKKKKRMKEEVQQNKFNFNINYVNF